jgi:hypothetical protein
MPRVYHATRGDERYTLELTETRIQVSRDMGSPDSFGGNLMPYARFLRSEKWQHYVRDIYGQHVLDAVLAAARAHAG